MVVFTLREELLGEEVTHIYTLDVSCIFIHALIHAAVRTRQTCVAHRRLPLSLEEHRLSSLEAASSSSCASTRARGRRRDRPCHPMSRSSAQNKKIKLSSRKKKVALPPDTLLLIYARAHIDVSGNGFDRMIETRARRTSGAKLSSSYSPATNQPIGHRHGEDIEIFVRIEEKSSEIIDV